MRTLIILSFLIAMVAISATAQADGLSWSSGVTLTEKEGSTTLGSRLEAISGDRIIGSWFSSSNMLPQIVSGLDYNAYGDFSGIQKVQRVELSPDHGTTVWSATLVEGKGYCVGLPALAAGSYALEWGVWSRDKRNRLVLLIIPINWSSGRLTSSVNHLMVQSAPAEWESYDDRMWFSCLRGFVSSEATPDMGYLAQQQAAAQMGHPAPQLAPVIQSQPEPEPAPAPVIREKPKPKVEKPRVEEKVYVLRGNYRLILSGMDDQNLPLNGVDAKVRLGDTLIFRHSGAEVARAKIVSFAPAKVFAEVYSESSAGIKPGDNISIEDKEVQ